MQDNDNDHDHDYDHDHGKMSQTVAGLNVRILTSRGMTPPTYATAGSAALDLRAALGEDEEVVIGPGSRVLIPTGIAIAPESTDVVAVVAARSGLAIKSGITLSNGIGVIDSDYRGEICVGLYNTSDKPFVVRRGDRIAQLMFMPVLQARFLEVTSAEELGVTGRGAGGFGSTGIH